MARAWEGGGGEGRATTHAAVLVGAAGKRVGALRNARSAHGLRRRGGLVRAAGAPVGLLRGGRGRRRAVVLRRRAVLRRGALLVAAAAAAAAAPARGLRRRGRRHRRHGGVVRRAPPDHGRRGRPREARCVGQRGVARRARRGGCRRALYNLPIHNARARLRVHVARKRRRRGRRRRGGRAAAGGRRGLRSARAKNVRALPRGEPRRAALRRAWGEGRVCVCDGGGGRLRRLFWGGAPRTSRGGKRARRYKRTPRPERGLGADWSLPLVEKGAREDIFGKNGRGGDGLREGRGGKGRRAALLDTARAVTAPPCIQRGEPAGPAAPNPNPLLPAAP